MKLDIGGVETIQAPVEVLWKALNDPVVLTRCIPGCKTMTEIAPDAYKVEMQLRVAAVGGSFEGEIALSDKEPPQACSILSTTCATFFAAANFSCQPQCRNPARAVVPGCSTRVLLSVARSNASATDSANTRAALVSMTASPT